MKQGMIRFISVLRKVLLLLGCLIFLWSVASPYYRYVRVGLSLSPWGGGSFAALYWSYTEKTVAAYFDRTVTWERWFLDYWFGNFDIDYLGYFLLRPMIFAAQVVTLVTGIFSIFKTNRTVAAVSAATCLATMFLMVCQNLLMSDTNQDPYCYQVGYGLTNPSLILFVAGFFLALIPHRSKAMGALEKSIVREHEQLGESLRSP
jgi:hypothetical protein